ncbi:class I SAM-dependent methyltransferase [Paenibacillus luteus]|uniref:class I SAM-dependent methyltransferase n=1 Tax=Paenibacillus luteus TaxID=2545753 RepID=UPI00114392BA|nr:methyltransferase domain-containing protein [Paenibacillus luteus]
MDLRVAPPKLEKIISPYLLHFLKSYSTTLSFDNQVLDLGSGKWRHANFMHRIGFKKITCIDRYTFPNQPDYITYIEHNLENKMHFIDNKFDIIIATFLFMFIKNRRGLIDEITRLSNHNSYLICTLNNKKTSTYRPALSFGNSTNSEDIIALLDPTFWIILHKNKDSFIAQRREGLTNG